MKLSIILILRPERDGGGGGGTMNKSGLGWISYRNTKLIPANNGIQPSIKETNLDIFQERKGISIPGNQ